MYTKKGSRLIHKLYCYLVAGVPGNSLPFVLISWGEIATSSSLAALLMEIMPIGTFVLAHLFIPAELMTGRKLLGITIGFTGLTVLVGLASLIELGQNIWGQLSVLGGALCYAAATVFVRTQPSFEIHKMAAGMCTVAAFLSLILAFTIDDPTTLVLNTNSLLAMFALGLFPTALASIIYFRVVRNLGATKFAQINYLIPILGGLWGIILLGETLEWNIFAALLLVLSGVYLVPVEKKIGRQMIKLR